jgi:hypothetical protein
VKQTHGVVDPLFAFAFLQSFVEILQEYFGTVSAATLKDNFDVVYQVNPTRLLFTLFDNDISVNSCSFSKKSSIPVVIR